MTSDRETAENRGAPRPGADVTTRDVARGAGLAGLARLGALIELVAQPAYIWMFGVATYGIYVVLWGAVNLLSNMLDLSMTNALQRVGPQAENEDEAHAAVKFALIAALVPTTVFAGVIWLLAPLIAPFLSAAPEDAARLPDAIRLFVWALPLWTFVEVCTAAARARRAFGPEIRLRIFWEQTARLVFAVGFFLLGWSSLGLMAAHLASLALVALLCLRLLGRYYDLGLIWRVEVPPFFAGKMVGAGFALLPAEVTRRLLIDAPPLVLNLMIPGVRGAEAAGLLEIARKLSTAPNIVRTAFRYVMAPLASAQARRDRRGMAPLYHFACRVSTALVAPLAAALVLTGPDILGVYRPEAMAALPLLGVLVLGRLLETMVGPASDVVEMTGHPALPLLNGVLAATTLGALAALLVPAQGAMGMAVAVAVAVTVGAFAAALELALTERMGAFDGWMARILGVCAAGTGLMLAMGFLPQPGIAHFVVVVGVIMPATMWAALRFGLPRENREALGRVGRRLRLT